MQCGVRVLRLLGIVLAATIAASGEALATYNLNLYCPGAGQTFDSITQPQVPADSNRPAASSILAGPRSIALGLASGDLRSPPRPGDISTSGVFTIEQALDFNVLDRALFFPERSQIVLLGHRDPQYAGAPIPYLQHLAALLDQPDPTFTLNWTPDSDRKVDAFLARMDNLGELKRLVDQAGTIWNGSKGVTQSGKWLLQYFGLKPNAAGEFPGLDRVDLNAAMLTKAGDRRAACVLLAMHTLSENAHTNANSKRLYFQSYLATLGIESEVIALNQQWRGGRLGESEYERRTVRLICNRLDQIFHLSGAINNALEDALRHHKSIAGAGPCNDEFDRHRRAITERAMDLALGDAREIVVPVDGIASLVGTRPEVVPEFTNVDPHSQLAKVMLEADYLGKRLINLPAFEARDIPGYKTEFLFNRDNPTRRVRKDATQHLWFSIDKVDANQSADGHALDVRDARIRINIREYDKNGKDKPPIAGGYGDLLTSLFPVLARRYPALRELQEVAKVGAVAKWIAAKQPSFKLPKEGRQTWRAPEKLPGVIYMALALKQSATSANTVLSAVGGVSLVIPYDLHGAISQIGNNLGANVVDLRPPVSLQVTYDKLDQLFDKGGGKPIALPPPIAWSKKSGNDKNSGAISVSLASAGTNTVLVHSSDADVLLSKDKLNSEIATAQEQLNQTTDPREKADRMVKLAYLLRDRGDIDEAVKLLNSARGVDPIADLIIARNESMQGNTSGALRNLELYVAHDPKNAPARDLLADLRRQQQESNGTKPLPPGRLTPFEQSKVATLWDDAAIDICRRDLLCGKQIPPDLKFHKTDLPKLVVLPDNVARLLETNADVKQALEPLLKAQQEKMDAIASLKSTGGSDKDLQQAEDNLEHAKSDLQKKVHEITVQYQLDPDQGEAAPSPNEKKSE